MHTKTRNVTEKIYFFASINGIKIAPKSFGWNTILGFFHHGWGTDPDFT